MYAIIYVMDKSVGRPTKYKKEYCEEMLKFFNIPHTRIEYKTKLDKNGDIKEIEIERPNSLPTFEKFACNINVCVDTLHEWKKVHQEFSEAYRQCQQLQKDMLIDLGMLGLYNAPFTQFVAKNITDMKDKQEVEQTNINKTPFEIKLIG